MSLLLTNSRSLNQGGGLYSLALQTLQRRGLFTLLPKKVKQKHLITLQRFCFRPQQPINPSSKLEDSLFNATTYNELFRLVLEHTPAVTSTSIDNSVEPMRWRHAFHFFRGLRHIQFAHGIKPTPSNTLDAQ